MRQLSAHLQIIGSMLTPARAAEEAIRAWIAATNPASEPASQAGPGSAASPRESTATTGTAGAAEGVAGYQWKTLFLPHGAQLRMTRASVTYTAQVVGNDIVFEGRRVSPRGMTVAIAGDGRNAWRDLSIRLPGERGWRTATRCRRDAERGAQTPALSPAQSMQAAAEAMSDALQTALALVELARLPALLDVGDRRGYQSRRADDMLGEDCAFDDAAQGHRA